MVVGHTEVCQVLANFGFFRIDGYTPGWRVNRPELRNLPPMPTTRAGAIYRQLT